MACCLRSLATGRCARRVITLGSFRVKMFLLYYPSTVTYAPSLKPACRLRTLDTCTNTHGAQVWHHRRVERDLFIKTDIYNCRKVGLRLDLIHPAWAGAAGAAPCQNDPFFCQKAREPMHRGRGVYTLVIGDGLAVLCGLFFFSRHLWL